MIVKDTHLDFLQKKIAQIGVAIFKSETNSLLQLSNTIVRTIKTDSDGNIWFFTSCNREYAKNIDKDFYAYLDFFQKGSECRLQVSGKASIIADDNDADSTPVINMHNNSRDVVLVKMKIQHAEYFENKPTHFESLTSRMKHFFAELFVQDQHRIFDFS
ncbi:MAG: pyridoxamine 5'-phosphate oxidase family protein [Ferruginibacter sp.]